MNCLLLGFSWKSIIYLFFFLYLYYIWCINIVFFSLQVFRVTIILRHLFFHSWLEWRSIPQFYDRWRHRTCRLYYGFCFCQFFRAQNTADVISHAQWDFMHFRRMCSSFCIRYDNFLFALIFLHLINKVWVKKPRHTQRLAFSFYLDNARF